MLMRQKTGLALASSCGAAMAFLMATSALAQTVPAPPAPTSPAPPQAAAADDKSAPVMEEIVVTADRKNSYSADLVQAGSFRGARQLDTPLTVSVITGELLKSEQAVDLIDALRNTASVSSSGVGPLVYNNVSIRGITVDTRSNFRLDGSLPVLSSIAFPLEDKDRVEVLKGASALYYGFSNPSGIVNLVMKRPTQDPYAEITALGNGYGAGGLAIDVSGTYNMVGARINALQSSLNSGIKNTVGERSFISGAFDIKPIEDLTIQLDFEHIFKKLPEPGVFRFTSAPASTLANFYPRILLPRLTDPSNNFGPTWGVNRAEEDNVLLKANYHISDSWSFIADYGTSNLSRIRRLSQLNPTNINTGEGQLTISMQNSRFSNQYIRGELGGTFYTGPLLHEVLIGISQNLKDSTSPVATKALCPGATPSAPMVTCTQNYFNPRPIPETAIPLQFADTNRINDIGYYVFDTIKYQEWLQVLGGIRYSDYTESDNTTGVDTFKAQPVSSSVGVVVKPYEWASIYGTYIEGLETTPPAPTTATNANQQLGATESTQYEAGIKVEPWKGLLIQLAYFDISRGSTYVNAANTYVLDGEASYKGEEISVSGEITDDFSLYANATYLDAKQDSGAPTIVTVSKGVTTVSATAVGKHIEATPALSFSVSGEYRFTGWLPGFSMTAGAYYTGKQAINALNQAFVPDYMTFAAGAAYRTELYGHMTTFRINGDNIFNTRYWASTGGLVLGEGLPASVKFSVSTKF
jgi:iron complex outermembrane receptor protein